MTSKENYAALLLRITPEMRDSLDQAAHGMQMSRTAFIRLSLARNLAYWRSVEAGECLQRLQVIARHEMVSAG